jgi:hypothetical protein
MANLWKNSGGVSSIVSLMSQGSGFPKHTRNHAERGLTFRSLFSSHEKKKTRGLSLRVKCTDRETAACRRS